jgi:predicted mannosyl-3-phosphoglycerate phosphatase (HAD superfamily)
VALISRLFGLGAPMIVENGAALIVPDGHLAHGVPGGAWDGEFHVLRLGPPRQTLREALLEVAAAARVEVRLAADLPPGDRSHGGVLAGLSAHASRRYEHTDPFLLEREEDAVALAREAEARSLRVARGKGLFHLCGGADKGLAVRTLLSLYEREGRPPEAIGLGTWPLDLPMLRAVARPIVLPGAGGRVDPDLAAGLRGAERAWQPGPLGWNEAVLAALGRRRLPRVPAPPRRRARPQPQVTRAAS